MAHSGSQVDIVARPLPKGTGKVSLSAMTFLFSEIIQYYQPRIDTGAELEQCLDNLGADIGARYLELVSIRDKKCLKETKLISMLQFISTNVWKALFGKVADTLEKSNDNDDEYMIFDKEPILLKYISVPREMGNLHCGAFIAGITRGMLCAAQFPAKVTASTYDDGSGSKLRTVLVIKFDASVMAREQRMSS